MKGCTAADVLAEQVVDVDPFALGLIEGVAAGRAELSARLARLLDTGWTVHRLGVCDRLILLQGLFELERGAAPAAVVINEAIELAHRLGATERSPGFVNGILAAAVPELTSSESALPEQDGE